MKMEVFDGRDLNRLSAEVKGKKLLISEETGNVGLMVVEVVVVGLLGPRPVIPEKTVSRNLVLETVV